MKESGFKVLVLDDVLHSVDAAHRGRIATLLKSEFADHQIVLVTHDKFFYERVRSVSARTAINTLPLQLGILIGDRSVATRVRTLIGSFPRKIAARRRRKISPPPAGACLSG